jgi:uncharacterized protein (TIGR03435 family)
MACATLVSYPQEVPMHALFLFPLLLCAQSPDDAVTFEVASVKTHIAAPGESTGSSQKGGPGTSDPGRIVATNRTLRTLVIEAYGIRGFQLEHPTWVGENRYDIVAKVPSGATHMQARTMMQNLLKERFHLEIRREKRERQVYALIASKNGPKLTQSASADPSAAPTEVDFSKLKTGGDGFPQAPAGAQTIMTTYMAGGKAKTTGLRQTMSKVVTWLTDVVNEPVINETGLKGEYDFSMVWNPNPDREGEVSVDIFAAVQQQLGLKLERRKMPIDMIVVVSALKEPVE